MRVPKLSAKDLSDCGICGRGYRPSVRERRDIAIKLHRSPNQLKPFDETDRFIIVREAIGKWAARCNLNRNPDMPAGFRGRTAENWRCLVAIADDLGFGYDEAARAAAVAWFGSAVRESAHHAADRYSNGV